jgi:hypothetical protein
MQHSNSLAKTPSLPSIYIENKVKKILRNDLSELEKVSNRALSGKNLPLKPIESIKKYFFIKVILKIRTNLIYSKKI